MCYYQLYFTVSNSNFLQFKQRYTDIYGMLEIKTIHMNIKFLGFIRFLGLGKKTIIDPPSIELCLLVASKVLGLKWM